MLEPQENRIAPMMQFDSEMDASINWVQQHENAGFLETRYVRGSGDYFVVYLSTQTGCKLGCRMCHLTTTGQVVALDARPDELFAHARHALNWYAKNASPAQVVHYNFMARGEPLESEYIRQDADYILGGLADEALSRGLLPKYQISTVMPQSFAKRSLVDTFAKIHPEIYYSFYSTDPVFRGYWLPHAMDHELALEKLADWQMHTAKIPKIHHAFIRGQNDTEAEVLRMCGAIKSRGLRVNMNILRYNPPNEKSGKEADEEFIKRAAEIFRSELPQAQVQVHARVGFDVQASCGMFMDETSLTRAGSVLAAQ